MATSNANLIHNIQSAPPEWSFTLLDGKRPLRRGWQTEPPLSRDLVIQHAQRGGNVGLRTGAASSNIVVVDVDPGADEAFVKRLPPTLTARTGRGGFHFYYQGPGRIGNSAGKLSPHVDVKGDGGQVVFVGSIHPDTKAPYRWETPPDAPLAPLPEWIIEALRDDAPSTPAATPENTFTATPAPTADFENRLAKILGRLLAAPEGKRNDALNRAAFAIGQMVAENALPEADAIRRLEGAASQLGLSNKETSATIRSGLAKGKSKPRQHTRAQQSQSQTPPNTPAGCTDSDNADRLAKRHGADFRFVAPWDRFVIWDGKRWRPDDTRQMDRWAESVSRDILEEAAGADDEAFRRLAKWAADSKQDFRVRAMINRVKSRRPILPDEMDGPNTTYLFNVANGVLNLRTGDLLPHDRNQYITKIANVIFDPAAQCPLWISVLRKSFDNNPNLISYFQRAVGYAMIGAILDRVIFILFGGGANGKTVIRETLNSLMGEYGIGAPMSTFMEKHDGGIPNDVARLKGARYVSASESEEGSRLAPALIKSVTGGDTITARFLRAEFFDFKPAFKIFLATNHKPVIPGGGDQALWDRIHLIPFLVRIPEAEQIPLATMLDDLRQEMSGILNWAVTGCLDYQANGLQPPQEVKAAVTQYRNDEDLLADFLGDECERDPMASCYSSDLFKRYSAWAQREGAKPMSAKSLGRRLGNHGVDSARDHTGRFYLGIGLKPERAGRVVCDV